MAAIVIARPHQRRAVRRFRERSKDLDQLTNKMLKDIPNHGKASGKIYIVDLIYDDIAREAHRSP